MDAWHTVSDSEWPHLNESSTLLTLSQELDIDADTRNGLLINNVAAVLPHFGRPQAISLIATQRRTDTGDRTPSMPIDFVLERLQPIRAAEDAHKMVIPVKFTVVGFGGKPVKVDTVSIDILQTEQVMKVMRVETVPFRSTPGAESCNGQSAWSYCRVKAIVSSRVRQTVAAMSQGGSRAKAWCGRKSAHGTHGPHRGHRGHHRSRARHWVKTLHSSLRFFVIPALLGVIGGLLASAVGMLVGQAVSYLWARTSRRRAGCRHCEAVDIVVYEDEKDGLLYCDEELPLPPPRYEDVESGLRADEKH